MSASDDMGTSVRKIFSGSSGYHASTDAALFSSSLPVLPRQKLNVKDADQTCQSIDDVSASLKKFHPHVGGNDVLEIDQNHAIGSLLPDDEDELLAGIVDGFDLGGLSHHVDDAEDFDFFGSGGGLELESDSLESLSMGISNASLSDGSPSNGVAHFGLSNGVGIVFGEHPLGEHPSRTLFVRNINSNVEDSELRSLFEQYGDIRTLYTACKHRGFVMISYYDIRAARTAMRALQNRPLRRRKLDIHFSIPKDNPSERDLNQGTLVVFNLDPSVSNDDLRQIFGAYGEVKEIRETPNKRHHKFVEYYDVRAAEAALRSLNRCDIAGKRIKLEPSRPGGSRRNFMFQLSHDPEQDEPQSCCHQAASSIGTSPPGDWPQLGSPLEHSPLQSLGKSPGLTSVSPTMGNNLPGLASILHPQSSNSMRVAPIGKNAVRSSYSEHVWPNRNSNVGAASQQTLSLHKPNSSQYSGTVSSFGDSSSNGSGVETLTGPQFLWGSPKLYPEPTDPLAWRGKSAGHPFTSNGRSHGFSFSNRVSLFGSSYGHHQHHHHHTGSAPSGVPLERHFGFYHEPPETFVKPSFGGVVYGYHDRNLMMNMSGSGTISVSGNMSENGSPSFGMMSSPGFGPMSLGNGYLSGLAATSLEGCSERVRARRVESNGNQMDNKKHFQLDLDKIKSGEDTRTTLMIKNIPNKYTSKMLLAAIDENHRGTYDFLYLPIDFKNKCNVGYAFINMMSPEYILPFYEAFNGKRWEKFNSEKVASLAYARIQGKMALVSHFQNSSLMNEDKRCRPILFHSEGSESVDKVIWEHLPSDCLNIQARPLYGSEPMDSPGNAVDDGRCDKLEQSWQ
ncbi:protein MEI2-like 5 [Coffea eugenioides]|uniref:protein MEI2-like 5 n=1 Tax=Coffea eugenioides TaxID=49369 RepID=UPI000F60D87B|nr:protein MEI2-like 5 [Coffea eugenioides]